ncbi:MAG: SDR family oxidoreductase [bacterium]|nr:SDR family oxidoreductase [bacterium]
MYALITGASSGIGREMARELARRDYDLIVVARRKDRLLALKEELEGKYGIDVQVMESDLSKPEHCVRLYKDCKGYPINLVINNAGFGKAGTFTDLSLEDELAMIQTNVSAVMTLTKLFARHMKQGRILNVSSIAAFYPTPMMSTYGASKSYVLSLSRSVNYEMKKKKKNVRVSVLCPGPVETEFNAVAGADMDLASISAKTCAKIAISGLLKGKEVIVPGFQTKLMWYLSKLAPESISLPIEYYIQSKKLSR